jgi:hypothetical protein
MATTVQMDYNNIQQQANVLHTASESMKGLSDAAKGMADSLKAVSFFPGIPVLIRYFEGISNAAKNLSQVQEHLSQGLKQAVQDHQAGDADIKGYFNLSLA